jgi:hypothetical protein
VASTSIFTIHSSYTTSRSWCSCHGGKIFLIENAIETGYFEETTIVYNRLRDKLYEALKRVGLNPMKPDGIISFLLRWLFYSGEY